jgi:hypothetical protein
MKQLSKPIFRNMTSQISALSVSEELLLPSPRHNKPMTCHLLNRAKPYIFMNLAARTSNLTQAYYNRIKHMHSITYQVCRAGSSGTDCSICTRCLWKICTQVNVSVRRLASDQATAKTGNIANEGPASEVDRGAKERMPTDPRHDSL